LHPREDLEAEYGELRARLIKQKLDEYGVDSSSCFDKEALLAKLVDLLLSLEPQVFFVRMCSARAL
jgi:hypothetical protein